MAKNQIQFQKGLSLTEFLSQYGTEEQCHDGLFEWRWPEGFVCPNCEHRGHCEIASRGVYQCYRCHHQTSVISGTIFEHTKLKGFRKEEIAQWAQRHLAASSIVVSDGLGCFKGVETAGCQHEVIVTGGGPKSVTLEAFTRVNTMIGNVKNSLYGT